MSEGRGEGGGRKNNEGVIMQIRMILEGRKSEGGTMFDVFWGDLVSEE